MLSVPTSTNGWVIAQRRLNLVQDQLYRVTFDMPNLYLGNGTYGTFIGFAMEGDENSPWLDYDANMTSNATGSYTFYIIPKTTQSDIYFKFSSWNNDYTNMVAEIDNFKIENVVNTANPMYSAVLNNLSETYAFGAPMPMRQANPNIYRYGFNGMEKDNEVKGDGNTYTTHNRAYDPRLGRWLSLDPAARSNMSMYVGFANNPIIKVDPRGDDDFFDKNGTLIYSTKVGNNIQVTNMTKEQFLKIVYIGTPVITAKLKTENGQASAMNHYLENYSAPFASQNLNEGSNREAAKNVISHYYNQLALKDNEGNTISAKDAIGGVHKGSWNAENNQFLDNRHPENSSTNSSKLGGIFLNYNSGGFINPVFSNKYDLMNVLVHEDSHLNNRAAGNENPASHLNAYLAQANHWTFAKTSEAYKDNVYKKIGSLLLYDQKRTAEVEKQLGVKFNYEENKSDGGTTYDVKYEKK